ncbi:hypothetical protein HHI36_018506, partial [Cryptolaemus montrouzieri]
MVTQLGDPAPTQSKYQPGTRNQYNCDSLYVDNHMNRKMSRNISHGPNKNMKGTHN